MKKVLAINRYTGIDQRASIGTPDHPIVNQEKAPSITDLNATFFKEGVPLAVRASEMALAEAGLAGPDMSQITHIVSATCTNSANPGFDHYVVKGLGMTHQVEKVLLHGIGCSGGLAALRTAANLALGHAMRGKPARILVVTLEVSTIMVRSELDSINESQETRIGVALFSDCGSAVVLSNGIGPVAEPIYDVLGWDHRIIPDTEEDLGFDVDPAGWKVVLSPRVPKMTASQLQPTFADLMASVKLPPTYQNAADFDWAMHPGGATILSGAERVLDITSHHMRASYDTYMNHGNSSSATIFSVLDRLRDADMDRLAVGGEGKPREYIIGCAFGPGISVETCVLKRNLNRTGTPLHATGLVTPPETESEASRSEAGDAEEAAAPAAAAPTTAEQFISSAINDLDLD